MAFSSAPVQKSSFSNVRKFLVTLVFVKHDESPYNIFYFSLSVFLVLIVQNLVMFGLKSKNVRYI